MKQRQRVLCCMLWAAGAVSGLYAQESVDSLLEGYLQNNLTVKQLSSQLQKQLLEFQSAEISNGWRVQLSTGTVRIQTGSDTSVTFSPKAELSLPQYNDLAVSVSSSIKFAEENSVENTSLSVSADLLSASRRQQQLTAMKNERAVLEARRALQNGLVSAEKEFYSELKSLYQTAASIVSAQNTLYDDQLTFSEVRAQGYSASSTRYRQAQMRVLSDQRTVENAQRELERQTKIFAAKCGTEYTGTDALAFLPDSIPAVDAVDVLSFAKEDYTQIESAVWKQTVNELTRQADSAFTLRGNAGYTFNNTSTKSDSVDVGASFTWNDTGLTAGAGASLPVGADQFAPVYTLSLSFDPRAFKLADIARQQDALDAEQELLTIDAAETAYGTAVISQQTSLADIQWEKATNTESLEMYTSLETDTARYYRQGYITESEYKSAVANKENYRLKCLINDIELIMYNDETKLLFCRDEELNHE